MVKGKPWSTKLEKEPTDLVATKASIGIIAVKLSQTKEAVHQKIRKLQLEVVEQRKIVRPTTSLPKELPSIEATLKKLSAALTALETPGLDKCEILRLRRIIVGTKIYKELLADYLDYHGLEIELIELS